MTKLFNNHPIGLLELVLALVDLMTDEPARDVTFEEWAREAAQTPSHPQHWKANELLDWLAEEDAATWRNVYSVAVEYRATRSIWDRSYRGRLDSHARTGRITLLETSSEKLTITRTSFPQSPALDQDITIRYERGTREARYTVVFTYDAKTLGEAWSLAQPLVQKLHTDKLINSVDADAYRVRFKAGTLSYDYIG